MATKTERREVHRERLLEGMLEAVGKEGYEAASVRAVLGRADLYRQAFYDNFGDKDECYLAAFDFGVERVAGRLAAAVAQVGEGDWRSRMRAGLAEFLAFCEDEPAVARALVVEVHVPGGEALLKRAATMRRIAAFVDTAREELGDDEEAPPAITAEGIVAGIHAVVYSRLATPPEGSGEPEFRALLPELMHLAVLPYFGSDAAAAEMRRAAAQS
jgi:AcrR family transcriptional regulator